MPPKDSLPAWAEVQKRTFTRWVNTHLSARDLRIEDLREDFSDGILLINLLELVSQKKIARYNKVIKNPAQRVENVGIALTFVKSEGIKLVGIGAEDIVNKYAKLILGLIWTLIQRYQISKGSGEKSAKAELLEWLNARLKQTEIKNFKQDWQDGKAIYYLVSSLKPGSLDESAIESLTPLERATKASEIAENDLKVPTLMEPADMVSDAVDDLSVMTYISYFRDYDLSPNKKEASEPAKPKTTTKSEDKPAPEPEPKSAPKEDVEEPAAKVVSKRVAGVKSVASGSGISRGTAGTKSVFTIRSKDESGADWTQGGAKIVVSITSGEQIDFKVVDHDDGSYEVSYTPSKAGKYTFEVLLNGDDVSGSPFHVTVDSAAEEEDPDDFDLERSEIDLSYLGELSDKQGRIYFVIKPKTRSGQPYTKKDYTFVTKIAYEETGEELATYPEENSEKFISVYFKPFKSGPYIFTVNAVHSSSKKSVPFKGTPANAVLQVHLYEEAEKIVERIVEERIAEEKAFVDEVFQDKAVAKIVQTEKFTGEAVGQAVEQVIERAVERADRAIEEAESAAGPDAELDLSLSVVSGDGIKNGETMEDPFQINVLLKDKQGDPLDLSANLLKYINIKILFGEKKYAVPFTVAAKRTGSWAVSYLRIKPGTYTIHVDHKTRGTLTPFTGSPWTASAEQVGRARRLALTMEPSESEISGDGLKAASVGKPATFTIHGKNALSKPLAVGGEIIHSQLRATNGHSDDVQITDNFDGTYTGNYVASIGGDSLLDVLVEDTKFPGSPFKVTVEGSSVQAPAPSASRTSAAQPEKIHVVSQATEAARGSDVDPANTTAHGEALSDGEWSEDAATFTIRSKDSSGNDLHTGGALFEVRVLFDSLQYLVPVKIKDNGDGKYAVSFYRIKAGSYAVHVGVIRGSEIIPISGSPWTTTVNVTGRGRRLVHSADAAESEIQGDGHKSAETGKKAKFTIIGKNSLSKLLTAGGEILHGKLKSSSGTATPLHVEDNGDGTYEVSYVPKTPGDYKLELFMFDEKFQGSPFKVSITGDEITDIATSHTSTSQSSSTAHAGSTGSAATYHEEVQSTLSFDGMAEPNQDGEVYFAIHTKSKKALEAGARFVAALTFTADNSDAGAKIVPAAEEGVYKVLFKPTKTGEYKAAVDFVDASGKSHKVNGTPVTITVNASEEEGEDIVPDFSGIVEFTDDVPSFVVGKKGNPTRGFEASTVYVPDNSKIKTDVVDLGDGTYKIKLHVTKPGEYTVSLSVIDEFGHSKKVKRSPFFVNVASVPSEAQLIAGRSSVDFSGLESGPAEDGSVYLLLDKIEEPNHYEATVRYTPDDSDVPVDISSAGDKVKVSFKPSKSGEHLLSIYVVGADKVQTKVKGSPFRVNVAVSTAHAPAADKCEASGPGLVTPEVGVKTSFTIYAKNSAGKNVAKAGLPFIVEVAGSQGAVRAAIEDNEDGTYSVTYTPKNIGPKLVTVYLEDRQIHDSPFSIVVSPPLINAEDTSADVTALKNKHAGDSISVAIEPRNTKGNIVTQGGNTFRAKAVHSSGADVTAEVTDHGDGTYTVKFRPEKAGKHSLDIEVADANKAFKHIQGSPYSFTLAPSKQALDPEFSIVSWQSLEGKSAGAGDISVTVEGKNYDGDLVVKGGASLHGKLTEPDGEQSSATVKDNNDGTYTVKVSPSAAGSYVLAITLIGDDDKPVNLKGSPHSFQVKAAFVETELDPDQVDSYGPGLKAAFLGEKMTFTIEPKNRKGSYLTKGGEKFVAVAHYSGDHGEGQHVDFKDNDDGTYNFFFVPAHLGETSVSVSHIGADGAKHPIAKSPFVVTVKPSFKLPTAENSVATGAGISKTKVNQKTRFSINAKNFEDTPVVVSGKLFEAHLTGPNTDNVAVSVEDVDDEVLQSLYTATKAGKWKLHVFLVGAEKKEIKGSPYEIDVAADIDASKIKITGLSASTLSEHPILADASASIALDLPEGDDVSSQIQLDLKGPEGKVPVVIKNENGKQFISFTPKDAGAHSLTATFDGEPLVGSPFSFAVEEDYDEEQLLAVNFEFTLQAKNRKGKNAWSPNSKFEVTISGPEGPVNAVVKTESDGKHHVSYSLAHHGKHTIDVKLNGKHIKGSPWQQIV